MTQLLKLFTPIKIGSMEVKNRIVMAPMTTNWAPDDGTISQKMIDYWEARAKGGVGLIIFEAVTIDVAFPYIIQTVGLWDDKLIPGFKRFVDAMHAQLMVPWSHRRLSILALNRSVGLKGRNLWDHLQLSVKLMARCVVSSL